MGIKRAQEIEQKKKLVDLISRSIDAIDRPTESTKEEKDSLIDELLGKLNDLSKRA